MQQSTFCTQFFPACVSRTRPNKGKQLKFDLFLPCFQGDGVRLKLFGFEGHWAGTAVLHCGQ